MIKLVFGDSVETKFKKVMMSDTWLDYCSIDMEDRKFVLIKPCASEATCSACKKQRKATLIFAMGAVSLGRVCSEKCTRKRIKQILDND